jgi:hypothetical protein
VVLDRVVQQGGTRDVGVSDAVVGEDPDADPQRMAGIRIALPPVPVMHPEHQRQCRADPGAVSGREPTRIDQQPFTQSLFPVNGGNRVQAHYRQQSPLRRIAPRRPRQVPDSRCYVLSRSHRPLLPG